jgi:hypothetical protein
MNKLLMVALVGGGVYLLVKQQHAYPVAQTVRNSSNRLTEAANRVRNTAVSVSGSINAAGAALGDIAATTGKVWDGFSRALNLGAAALPEYGSVQTSPTILAGTDPEVVAYGDQNYGGILNIDEGGENALDPRYYDAQNYNVNA